MATLRKIHGSYFAYFYDRSRSPKRKSVPLQVTLKDAAERKLKRLEKEWADGDFDPWSSERQVQRSLMYSEAVRIFLKEKSHLRPKTIQDYTQVLTAVDLPPLMLLQDIRAEHIRSYVHNPVIPENDKRRRKSTLSQATKRKRYTTLRVFVRWALKQRHIERSFLDEVPVPRQHLKLPRYLSPTDLDRLLNAVDFLTESNARLDIAWLRPAVLLAVSTGLRSGELRNLRWSDVSLDLCTLDVVNQGQYQTKSGNERRIPLAGPAVAVLQQLSTQRSGKDLNSYVLTDAEGKCIDIFRMSHGFKRVVRAAKLDDRLRFHDCRHTCGAWLASKGVPLRVIQQILGHATIGTTEIYSHLLPGTVREAMERAFGD